MQPFPPAPHSRFLLSEGPLEAQPGLVLPSHCGAVVSFWGRVRDHNEGRQVVGLEYQVYPELALKEGQRIVDEAVYKYGVSVVRACHRHGELSIGEAAVVVEVASGHRGEGFLACRYVIDELKSRVPIWKRERYAEGDCDWVLCQHSGGGGHPDGCQS